MDIVSVPTNSPTSSLDCTGGGGNNEETILIRNLTSSTASVISGQFLIEPHMTDPKKVLERDDCEGDREGNVAAAVIVEEEERQCQQESQFF
jgi:hypothetical protein